MKFLFSDAKNKNKIGFSDFKYIKITLNMPSKQKQKRKQRQERYACKENYYNRIFNLLIANVSTSSMDVDTSETESVAGSKSGRPTGGSKKVQQRINAGEQSVRARGLTGIGKYNKIFKKKI